MSARRILVVVVVVALVAGSGCATPNPHVEIPRAPSPTSPYAARAQYYKTYALDTREADHMFLHGGERVYWPEDLLPAVDDKSPAAMAIRDHVAARKKVEDYAWLADASSIGMGAGLAGLVGMLVPLVLPIPDDQQTGAVVAIAIGAGVLGVGGLGLGLLDVAIVGKDANAAGEAADRAARTYPQALSDRLGIGVDADGRLVDQTGPSVMTPAQTKGTESL